MSSETKSLFYEASNYFYGAQNKYMDQMHIFQKQEDQLNKHLVYHSTVQCEQNKNVFVITNVDSHFFIKNIRLHNMPKQYNVEYLIGDHIISMFNDKIYPIIVKRSKYMSLIENEITIPLTNIPALKHHQIKIKSKEFTENIQMFYDLYTYDMDNDPLSIVLNNAYKFEQIIEQVQYIENPQLCHYFNHPVSCIAIETEDQSTKFELTLEDKFVIPLYPPTYIINDLVVCEFPHCINMSRVSCSNINTNPSVYAFNLQVMVYISGMAGLRYSK